MIQYIVFLSGFFLGDSFICLWVVILLLFSLPHSTYSIAWTSHNLFFHSFVHGYLAYFQSRLLRIELLCPFLFFDHVCTCSNRIEWNSICSSLGDIAKQFIKGFVQFVFFVINFHPVH